VILAANLAVEPFRHGVFPGLVAGSVTDGREWQHFTAADAVGGILAFAQLRKCKTVYMHNGGKLAFNWFAELAESCFVVGDRIVELTVEGVSLRDSYALIPVPLASAGFREGIQELHALLRAFMARYGRHMTLGGAALKDLRRHGYRLRRLSESADTECRPFYAGGRVEAFATGPLGDGWQLADMRSAYPAAMMHPHPAGTRIVESQSLPDTGCWAAEIDARSTGAFGILTDHGYRYPRDGVIRTFRVTCHEVYAAQQSGIAEICRARKVLHFPDTRDFSRFIQWHWQARQEAASEGDTLAEAFHKLLMNVVYGKFGTDPRRFGIHIIMPDGLRPALPGDWHILRDIPAESGLDRTIWRRLLTEPERAEKYGNVATAASITGLVRAWMLQAISATAPVYADTDCVIARDTSALSAGPGLGEWRVSECSDLWIAGRKLYTAIVDGEERTATKGVNLTAAEVKRVCAGETIHWKAERPTIGLTRPPEFARRTVSRVDYAQ